MKRTSLAGVDLNRRWDNPHKVNHPTIFRTKSMMNRFKATREVIACCDIHGHSRREGELEYSMFGYKQHSQQKSHLHKGVFMYGCPKNWQNKSKLSSHTIPKLFDSQCEFFNIRRCTFKVQVEWL